MTCTVTGNVIDLQTQPKAGQTLTFGPQVRTVGRSGGSGTIPDPVTVTTDASGDFSVALLPGAYIVKTEGGTRASVQIVVPDAAGANFADIMNLTPPPPLSDAEQAELAAQQYASDAALSEAATAADRVQTGLDRVATGQDATATAADRVATGQDATATAADRVQTGLDRTATGQDATATAADRVATGQDASATAADRVQTGLDRNATGQDATATAADRVQTGLDRVATGQDATATTADRVQTGLDRVATGQDATATAADRVATGLDATATAADRVQTGLDRVATGGDATATAADRVQTGLDATATAADRVQTGLDATAAETARAEAQALVNQNGLIPLFGEILWPAGDPAPAYFTDTEERLLSGASARAILVYLGDIAGDFFDGGTEGFLIDATLPGVVFGPSGLASPGDSFVTALDQSQGLVLGPELADLSTAVAANFDGSEGVIDVANSRFSNQSETTSNTTYPRVYWPGLLEAGKNYLIQASATERMNSLTLGGTGGSASILETSFNDVVKAGSNGNISFTFDGREIFDVGISISIREIPGIHSIQPNAALRGKFGKAPKVVRNLFVETEDFTKQNGVRATLSNVAGAGRITEAAASGDHRLDFIGAAVVSGEQYTLEVDLKAQERSWARVLLSSTAFGTAYANVDLSNGDLGTVLGLSADVDGPDDDGFYRVTVSATAIAAVTAVNSIQVATSNNSVSYLGDGASGILVRTPQFGSSVGPYQRVGASNLDVTEAGVPSYGFLRPDLSDDVLPFTLPAAIDGDILIAGKKGTYIEPAAPSSGAFNVGPNTYTGGTPGILSAVGDIVGMSLIDKTLSEAERARIIRYFKGRGAKGLLVPGPELVTNGSAFVNTDGWVSARNGTTLSIESERLRATYTADQVYDGMSFAISGLTVGAAYLLDYDCYNGTTDDGLTFRFKPAPTLSGPGDFTPSLGSDDLSDSGVLLASASIMYVGLMGNTPVELGDYVEIARASVRRLIPEEEL